MRATRTTSEGPLRALDFFAGSGLVSVGLQPHFDTVWANDICPKKAAVYSANFPQHELMPMDLRDVHGGELPEADLAWASFPCQDLSLAGNMSGLNRGTRSSLFWEWIRVLAELKANDKCPSILCAENVVGFLHAGRGKHFKAAYAALRKLGYVAGAVVLDASWFLPQSRPRVFLIAVSEQAPWRRLAQAAPSAPFHNRAVIQAANVADDPEWVWWSLPSPRGRVGSFWEICDHDAPTDSSQKTRELLKLLSESNQRKLQTILRSGSFAVGTGYRRTRPDDDGRKTQRLEIRFDGIAGCLRTPEGGSSRQIVLIVKDGTVRSRLMTVRECARLMGADEQFVLPGTYNDGYRAMGDAVAVPVTGFLSEHLFAPLARGRTKVSAA